MTSRDQVIVWRCPSVEHCVGVVIVRVTLKCVLVVLLLMPLHQYSQHMRYSH